MTKFQKLTLALTALTVLIMGGTLWWQIATTTKPGEAFVISLVDDRSELPVHDVIVVTPPRAAEIVPNGRGQVEIPDSLINDEVEILDAKTRKLLRTWKVTRTAGALTRVKVPR